MLDAWARREYTPRDLEAKRLPFTGGWFVYLGYEVAAEVEPRLALPPSNAPYSAFALRVDTVAVHDVASGEVFAISGSAVSAPFSRFVPSTSS